MKIVFDTAIKAVLQPPKARKHKKKRLGCLVLWLNVWSPILSTNEPCKRYMTDSWMFSSYVWYIQMGIHMIAFAMHIALWKSIWECLLIMMIPSIFYYGKLETKVSFIFCSFFFLWDDRVGWLGGVTIPLVHAFIFPFSPCLWWHVIRPKWMMLCNIQSIYNDCNS